VTINIHKIFSKALLASDFQIEQSEILNHLTRGAKVSVETGFEAYRNNWRAGLSSALTDFYPSIKNLVGDECFGVLGLSFAEENPATVADLNQYGEEFSYFVGKELAELPYILDIARVDWYWHRIFYCKDDPAMDLNELEGLLELDPNKIVFKSSNSLRLLKSDFPILKIWEFAQAESSEDSEGVDLDEGGSSVVIWRKGFERRIEVIDTQCEIFLREILQGHSYGSIVSKYFSSLDESQITSILGQCFQSGWIVGVST